jgi:hypothetical protein
MCSPQCLLICHLCCKLSAPADICLLVLCECMFHSLQASWLQPPLPLPRPLLGARGRSTQATQLSLGATRMRGRPLRPTAQVSAPSALITCMWTLSQPILTCIGVITPVQHYTVKVSTQCHGTPQGRPCRIPVEVYTSELNPSPWSHVSDLRNSDPYLQVSLIWLMAPTQVQGPLHLA